jgi:hypothetical protein
MRSTWKTTSLINFILFLSGVWLIASPFLLSYSSLEVARNNDVYVGLVVSFLSLVGLFWQRSTSSSLAWLLGIAGLWEISAPFVLVYSNNPTALANGVIVGMLVVGLSLWQVLISPEESEVITRHLRPTNFGPTYASELNRRRSKDKEKEAEDKTFEHSA